MVKMVRKTFREWGAAVVIGGLAFAGVAQGQESSPQPAEPGGAAQQTESPGEAAQQRGTTGQATQQPGATGQATQQQGAAGQATQQPSTAGRDSQEFGADVQRNQSRGASGQATQPPEAIGRTNQQPGQFGRQPGADRGFARQSGGPGQISDPEIIAWLMVDNHGEIQISQLGQRQTSNPEVRQFAQQMVQDHSRMLQRLQSTLGGPDAQGQGRGQGQMANQPPIPPQLLDSNPLLGAYAELGQRAVQSARQVLQEKRGPEFDETFMEIQVAAHMKEMATLEVFSQQASPQLRPMLQQSQQEIRQHLDHARNLLAQVESQADSRGVAQFQGNQGSQPQRYSAGYGPRSSGAQQGMAQQGMANQGQWGQQYAPGGNQGYYGGNANQYQGGYSSPQQYSTGQRGYSSGYRGQSGYGGYGYNYWCR